MDESREIVTDSPVTVKTRYNTIPETRGPKTYGISSDGAGSYEKNVQINRVRVVYEHFEHSVC